jgi:hypothetical protein
MRLKDMHITQRVSDPNGRGKNRGEKKPLLTALDYYTGAFFAVIFHAPEGRSRFHREHG